MQALKDLENLFAVFRFKANAIIRKINPVKGFLFIQFPFFFLFLRQLVTLNGNMRTDSVFFELDGIVAPINSAILALPSIMFFMLIIIVLISQNDLPAQTNSRA